MSSQQERAVEVTHTCDAQEPASAEVLAQRVWHMTQTLLTSNSDCQCTNPKVLSEKLPLSTRASKHTKLYE
jgi:hypothetical protein